MRLRQIWTYRRHVAFACALALVFAVGFGLGMRASHRWLPSMPPVTPPMAPATSPLSPVHQDSDAMVFLTPTAAGAEGTIFLVHA